jgi:hypothetical protein
MSDATEKELIRWNSLTEEERNTERAKQLQTPLNPSWVSAFDHHRALHTIDRLRDHIIALEEARDLLQQRLMAIYFDLGSGQLGEDMKQMSCDVCHTHNQFVRNWEDLRLCVDCRREWEKSELRKTYLTVLGPSRNERLRRELIVCDWSNEQRKIMHNRGNK